MLRRGLAEVVVDGLDHGALVVLAEAQVVHEVSFAHELRGEGVDLGAVGGRGCGALALAFSEALVLGGHLRAEFRYRRHRARQPTAGRAEAHEYEYREHRHGGQGRRERRDRAMQLPLQRQVPERHTRHRDGGHEREGTYGAPGRAYQRKDGHGEGEEHSPRGRPEREREVAGPHAGPRDDHGGAEGARGWERADDACTGEGRHDNCAPKRGRRTIPVVPRERSLSEGLRRRTPPVGADVSRGSIVVLLGHGRWGRGPGVADVLRE